MAIIIFDLDGTLIDSAPDIYMATALTLREQELEPLDLATIRSFIGNGIPTLINRVMQRFFENIDTDLHALMEKRFMEHYTAAPTALTKLYPGVEETLNTLEAQGHQLALCTNKPEKTARTILDNLGIGGVFSVVIGGDTLAVRKPDPAPLRAVATALGIGNVAVYVGDSEVDEEAARAAGLAFLLFTEGYRKKPVEEMQFMASFSEFASLPELVSTHVLEDFPESRASR